MSKLGTQTIYSNRSNTKAPNITRGEGQNCCPLHSRYPRCGSWHVWFTGPHMRVLYLSTAFLCGCVGPCFVWTILSSWIMTCCHVSFVFGICDYFCLLLSLTFASILQQAISKPWTKSRSETLNKMPSQDVPLPSLLSLLFMQHHALLNGMDLRWSKLPR